MTSYEIAPVLGGYFFSSEQDVDPTLLYGLRGGVHTMGSSVVDSLGVEGNIAYFSSSAKSGGEKASGFIAGADLIYSFLPRKIWVPFLAVGGGGLFLDKGSEQESDPYFNYGLGVRYFLKNSLALRFEARHLFVYDDVSTKSNFAVTTGLSFFFGDEIKRIVPPPPPKAKPKTPQKAVPDIIDPDAQEPGGPKTPAAPDAGAEPPAAPAAPAAPEPATNGASPGSLDVPAGGDGLSGLSGEAEPAEPAPAPSGLLKESPAAETPESSAAEPPAAAKAPKKSAAAPKKPATSKEAAPAKRPAAAEEAPAAPAVPAEEKPEEVAAPAAPAPAPAREETKRKSPAVAKDLTLEFDFGSDAVRPVYYKRIETFAAVIKGNPKAKLRIEGHTDIVGPNEGNLVLSTKRAQNVAYLFIKNGVKPDKISIKAYGFTRPKASNATSKGRQLNRRAVVISIDTGSTDSK